MQELKYQIIENPNSKNVNFCFVMQAETKDYENSKYWLKCLTPLSMLLKSENKETLEAQISNEKSIFQENVCLRLSANVWINKNKIFSFLKNLYSDCYSKLFENSIFELDLKVFSTFPQKAFTSSPFWYIEDEKKLKDLKNDFLWYIKDQNENKYNFIKSLIKNLEKAKVTDFISKMQITQDSIENDLVEKYKEILLLSENSHFTTWNPFFLNKWELVKKDILSENLIISYNKDKDYFILEEWHHRMKAVLELLRSWDIDIWILDIFPIEFRLTTVSWATDIWKI